MVTETKLREIKERKERLMRKLSPSVILIVKNKERSVLESYFKSKAEEIFEGKPESKEERRLRVLMKMFACGTYLIIIIIFFVIVVIIFGTTNPTEIQRGAELMAIRLMGYF